MSPHFLTNSSSSPSAPSSDLTNDAVSLPSTSSSSTSSSLPDMWNYLWIPILISLSKELSLAKGAAAAAAARQSAILLPSELEDDSSAASLSVPRCPAPDPKLNYRPVIGILSHPGDGASGRLNNATNASYIAASYVKFVESAGARVIPLIYNEPRDILFKKLNLVNGVLFTGGWAKSGLYFNVAKGIFANILAKNDAGYHFPLYAICLGFELLTMIISKDKNILESFSAADQASTLQFMKNVDIDRTVFQRFPPDLLRKLSTDCLVMQNHHYGISPERLQDNQGLSSFFKVLTTSADGDNKVLILGSSVVYVL
uniref:folate gamma-glutamyl hydrolase n=1 Tax=Rhizophora mucronata TaxID=61149 RepID=A0A2P2KEC5_RHIMU